MRRVNLPIILLPAALVLAAAATVLFGGWLWGAGPVRGFQAAGGWLRLPMLGITSLGEELFYLLLIPLLYWCVDKDLGANLGVLLVLSSFANTTLKSFLIHPRPFWEDPALRMADAVGFSLPSGHAQNSATLFGYLAVRLAASRSGRRAWAILPAALIVLIGLSRVYLGVHFAGDVMWGWLAGLALLAAYVWLKPRVTPRLAGLPSGAHVLLGILAAAVAFGAVALALALAVSGGAAFTAFYAGARRTALDDAANTAGMAAGLWIGLALEARYLRFSVAGAPGQRAARYLIGIAGLFAVWMGLRVVFPSDPLALGLFLRVIRYGLLMLWAIVGWPWLFMRGRAIRQRRR